LWKNCALLYREQRKAPNREFLIIVHYASSYPMKSMRSLISFRRTIFYYMKGFFSASCEDRFLSAQPQHNHTQPLVVGLNSSLAISRELWRVWYSPSTLAVTKRSSYLSLPSAAFQSMFLKKAVM